MNEIVLLQSAQNDLLEVYSTHTLRFYERIEADLELIRRYPSGAPIFFGPIRRRVVSRTPFGIFYTVTGERVMVSAVLDLREAPDFIERRLGIQRRRNAGE